MKRLIIGLVLVALLLVPVSCAGAPAPEEEGAPPSAPEEAKCPISCSADSEGWSLVFECEEEGQMVTTRELEDRVTVWEDGKLSHMHAVIEYEFETSGNVYHAIIDIVPCEQSTTGYCITVEATGDTLGNEPVTCKNF